VISWKLKHLPDTPVSTVKKAYAIGKKEGLKNVYAGNIWEADAEDTYCSRCGKVAIKRVGYSAERLDKNGECVNCGKILEGVFEVK
jgi:pyruvate formate lyase activating enzyme